MSLQDKNTRNSYTSICRLTRKLALVMWTESVHTRSTRQREHATVTHLANVVWIYKAKKACISYVDEKAYIQDLHGKENTQQLRI